MKNNLDVDEIRCVIFPMCDFYESVAAALCDSRNLCAIITLNTAQK